MSVLTGKKSLVINFLSGICLEGEYDLWYEVFQVEPILVKVLMLPRRPVFPLLHYVFLSIESSTELIFEYLHSKKYASDAFITTV